MLKSLLKSIISQVSVEKFVVWKAAITAALYALRRCIALVCSYLVMACSMLIKLSSVVWDVLTIDVGFVAVVRVTPVVFCFVVRVVQ
jgi:hypothetical protein